jgi:hypothetical protein
LGLDEKWLQERISSDPSILGLDDLEIAGREHHQPIGGRIDFLMRDAEEQTYYEVEVMLGSLMRATSSARLSIGTSSASDDHNGTIGR